MDKKYNNYLKILKSKTTTYTQHDYEMANELLKKADDPAIKSEVKTLIDKMSEMAEHHNSDRMPL